MSDPTDPQEARSNGHLSIGDVAEATGISSDTLRMWERRYGRPVPVRLPSGHRRYSTDQVRWLRRVAEALSRGHRPRKVLGMPDDELETLLAPAVQPEQDAAIDGLVELFASFRGPEAVDVLREQWDGSNAVEFLDGQIVPLVHSIGRAWADGHIEVRHEHYASEQLEDLLRGLRTSFPLIKGDPRILLTTLSGETHGLGLQMVALICASLEVPFRLLGIDTPPAEIVRAAHELSPSIVALSVSLATGGVDTDRVISSLRSELPADVRLVVGGEGARGIRRGPRGVEYVADLVAWQEMIRTC